MMLPFVKWAGGKRQLKKRLQQEMPAQYNAYFEPFVGGGALVLFVQPLGTVYINDINPQLIHAYVTIRDNTEEFISRIQTLDSMKCTQEYYLAIRQQYNQKILNHIFDIETAVFFVYLNKHCFNGLYRVNGKGLFNVPWNHKEQVHSIDVNNILQISSYLKKKNIHIMNQDFSAIEEVCRPKDFVYFDSPYDKISKTSSFVDYTKESFKEEDHRRLAALFQRLTKKGVYCLATNHNTPLIRELYGEYRIAEIRVQRAINSDASKRMGKELIIKNY